MQEGEKGELTVFNTDLVGGSAAYSVVHTGPSNSTTWNGSCARQGVFLLKHTWDGGNGKILTI
jgi:hypothetical protein